LQLPPCSARRRSPGAQPAKAVAGGCLSDQSPEQDIVGARIGPTVAATIQRSSASGGIPTSLAPRFGGGVADHLPGVRIHRDENAHEAARMLNARAFTIGSSIYFGENQYQPASANGARLIAHELAHAVQQGSASIPRHADLTVAAPASKEEDEAERFAQATSLGTRPPQLQPRAASAARVMRVISFTRGNDRFTRATLARRRPLPRSRSRRVPRPHRTFAGTRRDDPRQSRRSVRELRVGLIRSCGRSGSTSNGATAHRRRGGEVM